MDAIDSEFADLMEQLRLGDQNAAWKIIDVYGPHIQRVVRRDLKQQLRSKFDSADFVQAVWASFFREPNRFRRLENPTELMDFLLAVAHNKVYDENRRRLDTQKTDVKREEPYEPEAHEVSNMPSKDPRPSQVAVAREQWHRFLSGQSDENRRIIELRFSGKTYEEIAVAVNRHERTVRRVVEQLLSLCDAG